MWIWWSLLSKCTLKISCSLSREVDAEEEDGPWKKKFVFVMRFVSSPIRLRTCFVVEDFHGEDFRRRDIDHGHIVELVAVFKCEMNCRLQNFEIKNLSSRFSGSRKLTSKSHPVLSRRQIATSMSSIAVICWFEGSNFIALSWLKKSCETYLKICQNILAICHLNIALPHSLRTLLIRNTCSWNILFKSAFSRASEFLQLSIRIAKVR